MVSVEFRTILIGLSHPSSPLPPSSSRLRVRSFVCSFVRSFVLFNPRLPPLVCLVFGLVYVAITYIMEEVVVRICWALSPSPRVSPHSLSFIFLFVYWFDGRSSGFLYSYCFGG